MLIQSFILNLARWHWFAPQEGLDPHFQNDFRERRYLEYKICQMLQNFANIRFFKSQILFSIAIKTADEIDVWKKAGGNRCLRQKAMITLKDNYKQNQHLL
jgi:hypothetical protein